MKWRLCNQGETIVEFETTHSITFEEAIDMCGFEKLEKVNIDDPDCTYDGLEYWYDDMYLICVG